MTDGIGKVLLKFFAPDLAAENVSSTGTIERKFDILTEYLLSSPPDPEARKNIIRFRHNPSEQTLEKLFTSGPSASIFVKRLNIWRPALEVLARNSFAGERAWQLGIDGRDSEAPRAFYDEAQKITSYRDLPILIAPAAADISNIPYRAMAVRSILSLLKNPKVVQKVVVVFTHINSELRQFVVPQLGSLLGEGGIPYRYVKFSSGAKSNGKHETSDADNYIGHFRGMSGQDSLYTSSRIPVDYLDMDEAQINKLLEREFFINLPKRSFVILDFLEFEPRVAKSPEQLFKPYSSFLKKLAGRLKRGNKQLIIFINSHFLEYNNSWKNFLPLIQALRVEQPNFSAMGLNSQLMNPNQAAGYLGLNPALVKLIATKMPLLPSIVLRLKRFMNMSGGPLHKNVRDFIGQLPEKEIIISMKDEFELLQNHAIAPAQFWPLWGHNFLVLGKDGAVQPIDVAIRETTVERKKLDGVRSSQMSERRSEERDLFDTSATLQNIPRDILSDDDDLMRWLLEHRDRITVENLHAIGKIPQKQFIHREIDENYKHVDKSHFLAKLVTALHEGGLIDYERFTNIRSHASSPLDYFLRRIEKIADKIRAVKVTKRPLHETDLSLFTDIKDPSRRLSLNYIIRIARWGRWFLKNEGNIVLRSIYDAKEISFMIRSKYSDILNRVPGDISDELKIAGLNHEGHPVGARRDAVRTLKRVLDYYGGLAESGAAIDDDTQKGLEQIRNLYEWNKDALGKDRGGSSSVPPPASKNSPPTPKAPESAGNEMSGAMKAALVDAGARTFTGAGVDSSSWFSAKPASFETTAGVY